MRSQYFLSSIITFRNLLGLLVLLPLRPIFRARAGAGAGLGVFLAVEIGRL